MRRRNYRCEHESALMWPSGRRALALACCGTAWLVIVGSSVCREPTHTPAGRPVSGNTLSQFLFPSFAKNDKSPQESTKARVAARSRATSTSQTSSQTATTLLQQPSYVAPEGASTIVPVRYAVAYPTSADQTATTARSSRAFAATASRTKSNRAPTSDIRSLWHTILGTNGKPTSSAAVVTTRQPPPAQRPLSADTNSAAPATMTAGQIAGELLGQITGTKGVSYPASSSAVAASTASNRFAQEEPVEAPLAKSQEEQSSRWLPDIKLTSSEVPSGQAEPAPLTRVASLSTSTTLGDKPPTVPASATPTDSAQETPYAVTSAPAFDFPLGAIPPPAAMNDISQALSESVQTGGAFAELWRPIMMDTYAPALPKPSERIAASAEAARIKLSMSNDGGSTFASLMLQPFQITNGTSSTANGGTPNTDVAANDPAASTTIAETIENSSLFHQLSMNVNGEAYASQDSESELDGGSKLLRGEQIAEFGSRPSTDKILQTAATDDASARGGRELVALMQQLAPEPADLSADTDDLQPVPAPEPGAEGTGDKKEDTLEGAEKLGEAPVDRSLEFLRTETVLLKPGESQYDVGIAYIFSDNEFPILLSDGGEIVAVTDVRFLVRELTVPLEYRVGLHKRVQGFLNLPIGWANTQIDVANEEDFNNDGGIGDLTFGLTIQCVEATANCPFVITTVSGTAPTGGDPFTGVVGVSPTAPSLGDGFWSVQGTLLFIQQYDPVVLFYGLGVREQFEHEYVGIDFRPGTQYNYLLGVGFAVNERITLSTRFFGSYYEELRANGVRILGTNTEPMNIRMSATISKPCHRLVEPYVEFGLNDDSVNSNVGITWTF